MSAVSDSPWLEVRVHAPAAEADELEQWLFTAGALSVTLLDEQDQPILEPAPGELPLWDHLVLVGLFEQGIDDTSLRAALDEAGTQCALKALPAYRVDGLAERQWVREWMRDFKPMQFGRRLFVLPHHAEMPADAHADEAIVLRLDPGLAFGTGTHPTTALCLSWLGDLPIEALKGARVIDYGCGSGILAIAAARLGAAEVLAVDIDEQAVWATRQNADANGVSGVVSAGLPDSLDSQEPVDLLLANILFQPLCDLAARLTAALRPGGRLVMSGVLDYQLEALSMRYNTGFDLDDPRCQDGWALQSATRRSGEDL